MAAFVSEVEVGVRADYHFTAITTNFAQFDLSIYMNNDKDQSALEFSHPGLVQHYSGYFRIFHQVQCSVPMLGCGLTRPGWFVSA